MSEKTNINWFPGHMTKALRQMEKNIKNVDVIFYCLDARAPLSCLNPKLTNLAKDKKVIYVLTKADMVEIKDLDRFKNKLISNNSDIVYINSTQTNSSKVLLEKAKNLLCTKFDKANEKELNYIIKAMVVGVPNVGKSTLINNFCGKSKAITGNKPGVTKGQQWLVSKDGQITLLDTPGTLWPSFDNGKTANNLAYIGSIKDSVLDLSDLAYNFLRDILKINKKLIEDRYKIKIEKEKNFDREDILQIFDDICESRKCILKGNELDYDRCSRLILDDFRKNRLGKIILD